MYSYPTIQAVHYIGHYAFPTLFSEATVLPELIRIYTASSLGCVGQSKSSMQRDISLFQQLPLLVQANQTS
jgi:hypothetical protein